MLLLAKRAGVSPATPYNVFGTKASILYVLLNESLDKIFSRFDATGAKQQPHAVALSAADAAAGFFIADPGFYRPLYQHLIGVSDPIHRPHYMDRALQYWRAALKPLRESRVLRSDAERDTVARAILIHFVGAMDLWVQREINSTQFRAHVAHGVCSILLGYSNGKVSSSLKAILRATHRAMPRQFTFSK